MKQSSIISLFFAFATSINLYAADNISIMSYNVRNGIGIDRVTDLSRVATTIKEQAPDVVCLQEIDSVTVRSKGKYVLGDLAEQLNMQPYFSAAINFGGGKYGIGLLARKPAEHVKRIPLPGREESRTLLIADFGNYAIACTHLSLTHEDQLLSIPIIIAEAEKYNKPFYICGDFNAKPDSPTIQELRKSFTIISQTDSATYPSDKPTELIDYIMVYKANEKRVNIQNAHVVKGTLASDHLPQCVRVTQTGN